LETKNAKNSQKSARGPKTASEKPGNTGHSRKHKKKRKRVLGKKVPQVSQKKGKKKRKNVVQTKPGKKTNQKTRRNKSPETRRIKKGRNFVFPTSKCQK